MYRIGQLAQAAQVNVETIRFYQRKGLLHLPDNTQGMRHYSEQDLTRLRFIRQAQAAGFSLKEINQLLLLESSQDREQIRQLALLRIAALNQNISQLQQARDKLEQLACQCATSPADEPCPILQAFDSPSAFPSADISG